MLSWVDDDVNPEELVEPCSESGLLNAFDVDGRTFEFTAIGIMRLNRFFELFSFRSSRLDPLDWLEALETCDFAAVVDSFGSATILCFAGRAVAVFGMPDPCFGKLDRLFAIANVCSVS